MNRPRLRSRYALALVALFALGIARGTGAAPATPTAVVATPVPVAVAPAFPVATTVILVRHAEKNPHPSGGDAGLSTKGIVRAQALARTLADAGVTAIYASQFGRARLTGEPLAQAIGDSVRTYDANHIDALVQRVREEGRGRTVLIIGHSDTIGETYADLTGEALPKDENYAYDRLYIVTFAPDGTHRLVRLRYGAPAD
jgi:broad specificity phosphatase PhoE